MGILTEQFDAIRATIESTVENALDTTMFDGLVEALAKSARANVYSYANKSAYFAAKRRYTIADRDNMARMGGGLTMILRNQAITQGGDGGEVNWVEEGIHQDGAGARPFMEEGLQEYAADRASADLASALRDAGFDAHLG